MVTVWQITRFTGMLVYSCEVSHLPEETCSMHIQMHGYLVLKLGTEATAQLVKCLLACLMPGFTS